MFAGLRSVGIPEALPPGPATLTVAYALSATGIVMATVAVLVMRRRVPGRTPGQSEEQYWARQDVAAAVVPVWFLLEGAGIVAAAAYLLTALPVAAAATAALVAAYWLNGPGSFTRIH